MNLDEKTWHRDVLTTKVQTKPVHPHSLISAFVIHLLERAIQPTKSGFLTLWLRYFNYYNKL